MILEQILAELVKLNANLANGGAQGAPMQPSQLQAAQQPQPALNAPAAVTDTGQPINGDTIVALIQPHIDVPAKKEAFGAAMRAMGINALPETQPHQFGALYTAFKNVIAQYASTASNSII